MRAASEGCDVVLAAVRAGHFRSLTRTVPDLMISAAPDAADRVMAGRLDVAEPLAAEALYSAISVPKNRDTKLREVYRSKFLEGTNLSGVVGGDEDGGDFSSAASCVDLPQASGAEEPGELVLEVGGDLLDVSVDVEAM